MNRTQHFKISLFGSLLLLMVIGHSRVLIGQNVHPERLSVKGNQIVIKESGAPVILRGGALADPLFTGRPADEILQLATTSFKTNAVRIPLEPHSWMLTEGETWDSTTIDQWKATLELNLTNEIDELVYTARQRGLYIILDLHFVDNNERNFTHRMNQARAFWDVVAPRYANDDHVLFEVYNEPGNAGVENTDQSHFDAWRPYADSLIQHIRTYANDSVLLVSGHEWATKTGIAASNPYIDPNPDAGLVYVVHIYPRHNPNDWIWMFGSLSDQYPVIITEWGYGSPVNDNTGMIDEEEDACGKRGDYQCNWELYWPSLKAYGEHLKAYVSERGISWTAFAFDNAWDPQIFDPNWNVLAADEFMGAFVQSWLADVEQSERIIGAPEEELVAGDVYHIRTRFDRRLQDELNFRLKHPGENAIEFTYLRSTGEAWLHADTNGEEFANLISYFYRETPYALEVDWVFEIEDSWPAVAGGVEMEVDLSGGPHAQFDLAFSHPPNWILGFPETVYSNESIQFTTFHDGADDHDQIYLHIDHPAEEADININYNVDSKWFNPWGGGEYINITNLSVSDSQEINGSYTVDWAIEFENSWPETEGDIKVGIERENGWHYEENAAFVHTVSPMFSNTFGDRVFMSFPKQGELPSEFTLEQNFPNPFNPVTNIRFGIASGEHITLGIFDMNGREIQRLVDGFRGAGWYEVSVDASHLPSGVYVYQLSSPSVRFSEKMTLLK